MHTLRVPGLRPGVDAARLEWRETQVAGVGWIPLYLEGSSGPRAAGEPAGSAVLIRMDAGCGYPRHTHVDVEEVLVLSGGYADELGEYREGEYVRYEAGSSHAPVALEGGPCVLFATARGGIRIDE